MQHIITIVFFIFVSIAINAQSPAENLVKLDIELPAVKAPVANFVNYRQVGNTLYISGTGSKAKGKLGKELNKEEGYAAARQTGISIIAKINEACGGDLSRVKQFVKVRGMVQSTEDFYNQPFVINGFSDLMVEVFGEAGKHARAAVGHNSLPFNIALEIEVIIELKEK